MFTGLIEAVGTVVAIHRVGDSARLSIASGFDPVTIPIGSSVAVSGVCLTVVSVGSTTFEADVSHETVARTSLADLKVGEQVHLERALAVGDRLDGHIVQGHVDFKARVRSVRRRGEGFDIAFDVPTAQMVFIVEKGSVAVDGVSLTVATVDDAGFSVTIVPHTGRETLLPQLATGDWANIETDILGKYVVNLIRRSRGESGGIDIDFLKKHGFA